MNLPALSDMLHVPIRLYISKHLSRFVFKCFSIKSTAGAARQPGSHQSSTKFTPILLLIANPLLSDNIAIRNQFLAWTMTSYTISIINQTDYRELTQPVTNITLHSKSNMAGTAFHRSQALRVEITNY